MPALSLNFAISVLAFSPNSLTVLENSITEVKLPVFSASFNKDFSLTNEALNLAANSLDVFTALVTLSDTFYTSAR